MNNPYLCSKDKLFGKKHYNICYIQFMFRAPFLLCLLQLVTRNTANMWDNIYSQAYAASPIILSESLNLNFKIPQYQLDANLDYNNDKQIITLIYYFDLLLTRLEVLKLQVDLNTLTLSSVRAGKMGCEKFKLAALADRKIEVNKVSKDNLFLVNILFKYVGRDHSNGKQWQKYKFDPFLFSSSEQVLDRAKKELQQNINDPEMQSQIEELDDLQISFDLFVSVDPQSGKVQRIAEGKKERDVPFELVSHVKNPMICEGEVKVLTNSDLRKMLQFLAKNRGNYQNLIDSNIPFH